MVVGTRPQHTNDKDHQAFSDTAAQCPTISRRFGRMKTFFSLKLPTGNAWISSYTNASQSPKSKAKCAIYTDQTPGAAAEKPSALMPSSNMMSSSALCMGAPHLTVPLSSTA